MAQSTELEQYKRLISESRSSLAFPEKIEKNYQNDYQHEFLTSNARLVCFGVFFYSSFVIADYLFFNDQFINLTIFRFLISLISFTLFYQIYVKKKYQYVINVTLIMNIAMGIQMFMSGILFFEQPLDIVYAVGIFPIMVYGIILFQVCFKQTLIVVFTLFSGLMLTLGLSYPFDTMNNPLFDMMVSFLPLLIVFTATICIMGAYTAYSMEKLNRTNWLKNKLLEIDSKRLNKLTKQLHTLSITDGLTNLYNRRFFDEQLLKHWKLCKEADQPISLIMADADWFKAYNDTYGHQMGDTCLKSLSQCLLDVCSEHEAIVSRYGGEEFIIILPNMPRDHTVEIAQQICNGVLALKIPHKNSPYGYCTLSVGVDTRYPADTENTSKTQDSGWVLRFLQQVDTALYQAKAKGKNQVCVFDETRSLKP